MSVDFKEPEQPEMFDPTNEHAKEFDVWVHSPAGGMAMNLFIRLAIGVRRRGRRIGAKAIAERIRWHFFVRKPATEQWRINNNYVAYMARFAMRRAAELNGFFELRKTEENEFVARTRRANQQKQE